MKQNQSPKQAIDALKSAIQENDLIETKKKLEELGYTGNKLAIHNCAMNLIQNPEKVDSLKSLKS